MKVDRLPLGTSPNGTSNQVAKGAARPRGTTDEPKFVRLIVGLPVDLDRALRLKAQAEDRPLAWIVRKAVEEYLTPVLDQEKET